MFLHIPNMIKFLIISTHAHNWNYATVQLLEIIQIISIIQFLDNTSTTNYSSNW